jgi:predicted phage terminase large subunit-like protein
MKLPPQPASARRELNAVLRTNFHAFGQRVFRELHPGQPFLDNWHVEAMTWKLDQVRLGYCTRLILNVPPRSAKSMLTSIALPAFILGHEPGARILCISHTVDLATRFGRECRQVMESAWYREIFPGTKLSKRSEDMLETTRGGSRKAVSLEAGITGSGGLFILIDDPITVNDAHSAVELEKANRLYRESVFTRLDNKVEGRIVLAMQRVAPEDLSGFLGQSQRFERLILPATAIKDEEFQLWGGRIHQRRAGDLLHPAKEPQSALAEIRDTMSAQSYAAQFQQDPVPNEGQIIKRDWIKRYDRPPPRDEMRIVISIDTATKGVLSADWSVATVWGEKDGVHKLLDVYRKKVDLPQLVADVVDLNRTYNADNILVEEQGNGAGLIAYLKVQGIYALGQRPKDDKAARLNKASYYFEKGQVQFPREEPWLLELERELLQFPQGKHDDQVDTISQYLNWSHERGSSTFSYDFLNLSQDPTPEDIAWRIINRRPWLPPGT